MIEDEARLRPEWQPDIDHFVEVGVEDTPGLKLKADIAVAPEPDLFSAGIAVRHAGLAQDRMLVKDFGAVDNGLDEPFFNA